MNSPEFIRKQLWEPFEKQPGWVYLAFAVYIGVDALSLRGHLLSSELWVVILTPIFYWVGDGVDAAVFKRSDRNERLALKGLNDARKSARDALLVQDGVYDVLMKLLARSGDPHQKAQVHFQNEFAKFARSAALPLLGIGIYLAQTRDSRFALLVGLSPLLMIAAFYLKLGHMRTLYRMAVSVRRSPKYAFHDLDIKGAASRVRLFLWDGALVASAVLVRDEKKRTGTAVLVDDVHSSRANSLAQH